MKKLIAVLAVIVLSVLVFLPLSQGEMLVATRSNSTIPTPGTVEWGEHMEGSMIQNITDVQFVENDAFLSGVVNYPYEFEYGLYMHVKNQRITVDVWMRNFTGYPYDNRGRYLDVTKDSSTDYLKKIIRAEIYQKSEWKNRTFNTTGDASSKYIAPDMAEIYSELVSVGQDGKEYRNTIHWRFSFLTNSSYSVGVFAVRFELYMSWWNWLWQEHAWEYMATIYGELTVGHFWIPTDRPPNDVNYNEQTHTWPPAQFNATVIDGKYQIKFWYAGRNGSWDFDPLNGTLKGPEVQLMKTYPSDTEYYTRADNPIHIEYPFDGTQPAGAYIWEVISYSHDGGTLYAWSLVISNNITSEHIENGTVQDHPPRIVVSFDTGGETPTINHQIYIVLKAYDNDSTSVDVWIIAFYSTNLYEAPPPWMSTMVFFNYPVHLDANGNEVKVPVTLRFGGQFNVYVWGKDDGGAFGKAKNFIMVRDFEGAPGGIPEDTPDWFRWPWESTVNLIILLFGVIMMFSRRPTLQVIGILLFFLAFVNWDYAMQQVKDFFNPLSHWGVITWPG